MTIALHPGWTGSAPSSSQWTRLAPGVRTHALAPGIVLARLDAGARWPREELHTCVKALEILEGGLFLGIPDASPDPYVTAGWSVTAETRTRHTPRAGDQGCVLLCTYPAILQTPAGQGGRSRRSGRRGLVARSTPPTVVFCPGWTGCPPSPSQWTDLAPGVCTRALTPGIHLARLQAGSRWPEEEIHTSVKALEILEGGLFLGIPDASPDPYVTAGWSVTAAIFTRHTPCAGDQGCVLLSTSPALLQAPAGRGGRSSSGGGRPNSVAV